MMARTIEQRQEMIQRCGLCPGDRVRVVLIDTVCEVFANGIGLESHGSIVVESSDLIEISKL